MEEMMPYRENNRPPKETDETEPHPYEEEVKSLTNSYRVIERRGLFVVQVRYAGLDGWEDHMYQSHNKKSEDDAISAARDYHTRSRHRAIDEVETRHNVLIPVFEIG